MFQSEITPDLFLFMWGTPSRSLPERIRSITAAICLIIYWCIALKNHLIFCCACARTLLCPESVCEYLVGFFLFVFLVQQTHFVSAHSSFVMETAVRCRYIFCVCILITDQQNDLMRQSSKPPQASLSSSCKYVGVVTWGLFILI